MSDNNQQPSGFVVFLRGLVRLVLILLIGVIIGGGLYLAGDYLFQKAIVPTQQNVLRLDSLEDRVSEQWDLNREQNQDMQERLASLENEQTALENQLAEMESELQLIEQNLEELDGQQVDLLAQFEDVEDAISDLENEQDNLAELNEQLQADLESQEPEELLRPVWIEVQLLKTMQQVNRSRLFLIQDNYGLARQELETAARIVDNLLNVVSEDQTDRVLLWKARIELAISHLPDNPALANEDLEILWDLLASGFMEPSGETEAESTAVSTAEESTAETPSSSSEEADATPDPTATTSPTPTPTPSPTP